MKKQIVIQRFDGGIADDVREQSINKCGSTIHFDNFSNPFQLAPIRNSIDAYSGQTTLQGKHFLMYGSNLYVRGRQSAADKPALIKSTDLTGTTWSTPTNADTAVDTNSATSELFIEYKGTIYGADVDGLWSYAGTTWTDDAQVLTFTSIVQGLVHSKNDILCIGYTDSTAAYVMTKNGAGAFNTTALTLPSGLKIESLSEYGNFLAIACSPVSGGGSSKVYLWDMVQTDVSAVLDLGERIVKVIESLDDKLIAISYTPTLSSLTPVKVVFSQYDGIGFKKIKEFPIASGTVISAKQKYNDRLYFGIDGQSIGGSTDDLTGIWSVGRNQLGEFNLAFTYKPDNDTVPQTIKGFLISQDYCFISYQDTTTGDYGMSKLNNSATYTATSIYETVKFNGGDINKRKRLIGVAVSKSSTTGQVVLKYKTETDSSYVTMHTMVTGTAVSQELINIVASGKNLPEFNEIQFRIESTGGAVITALKIVYNDDPSNLLTTK